ncbi:MAG: hypothetical protein KF748_08040 [Xanthobacteraceae bacterium]|nr:hypothetical protein [Xanthobacteraceae bacterium]MCW5676620.1 hypothetical protein [Xanthobacteraceae bacterium]
MPLLFATRMLALCSTQAAIPQRQFRHWNDMSEIQNLVESILDEKSSREDRAIALFEFQVWIHYPGPHSRAKKDRQDQINESNEKRRRARIFAASKLLDKRWDLLREIHRARFGIEVAVRDEAFRTIFDKYLSAGRGLYDLRNTPGGRRLRNELRDQANDAKSIGGIVEFCLCYSNHIVNRKPPKNRKERPLGFENVKQILQSETNKKLARSVLGSGQSRTTIGDRKRRFYHSAPFIFLNNNPGVEPVFPESCRRRAFADELLALIEDTQKLQRYFGLYEGVRARLGPLGHEFPATGRNPLPFEEIPIDMRFDEDTAKLIERSALR